MTVVKDRLGVGSVWARQARPRDKFQGDFGQLPPTTRIVTNLWLKAEVLLASRWKFTFYT